MIDRGASENSSQAYRCPPGGASAGQGKLSYTAATDRYVELATTDSTWRGSCRTVDLRLADGTHHTVNVRFNR